MKSSVFLSPSVMPFMWHIHKKIKINKLIIRDEYFKTVELVDGNLYPHFVFNSLIVKRNTFM